MDRTAWIVVALCAIALIVLFQKNARRAAEGRQASKAAEEVQADPSEQEEAPGPGEAAPAPQPDDEPGVPQPVNVPLLAEEELRIETEEALFQFTQLGGGVRTVTLKNHQGIAPGNVQLNANGLAPIGAFARRDGLTDSPITYAATRGADGTLFFRGENPDTKIRITKTYATTADPYLLDLKIDLENKSGVGHSSRDYYLHTGALEFLHPREMALYLTFNWCEEGEAKKKAVNWFDGGGFIFRKPPRPVFERESEQLQWAGTLNQFYASLIVPGEAGSRRVWARRTPVTLPEVEGAPKRKDFHAIYGAVSLPEVILPRNAETSYHFQIYTGPRQLKRLERLGHDLDEVMHYDDMPIFGGMFGLIPLLSTNLLKLMIWLAGLTQNWGVAILIITCLIRILIWPLHAKSTSTMKRMAKLAPVLKELKEKHRDDPQKMQQETMKLYRDYRINPLGGCLPVFLQLPIFLSFYKMLQSAVELRDQRFLWVEDLAMPDAIYHFQNFSLFGVSSINLMPLLMAGTMILQMKIGPKAGDKMQRRIFMCMPVVFLFICYNFASALALYWTGQNIFSIGQTWLMNRRPEPELVKRSRKRRMTLQDLRAQQQLGGRPRKAKKRPRRTGG